MYDYDLKQYQVHSRVELPLQEIDPSEDVCTIQSEPMTLEDRVVEEEKPTQLDLMFEDGTLMDGRMDGWMDGWLNGWIDV